MQLGLDLLFGQVAAVALLQDARPDGVVPVVVGRRLAQGLGPAGVFGAGLALDQLPVPEGGAAAPPVFVGHGSSFPVW